MRFRSALSHTYFTADEQRVIAKALLEHVDRNKILPTTSTLLEDIRPNVNDEFFEGVEKVMARLYKDDISDAAAVMDKAVDFGKTQALVNAVIEAADEIEDGHREKVLPLVQEALVVGEDLIDVGIDYYGTLEDRNAWYEQEDEASYIPTGIPHLDYALGGGLGRGELYVILAPPKRGKTTTLVNIGFGALRAIRASAQKGYNVAYYSCEMRDRKIARRFDDRLAGNIIKDKRSDPAKYAEAIKRRVKAYIHGRLFVKSYPTRTAGVNTIRSHLSLLASRGFHPDVIIVDYADIMKAERRLGEMRHEQAGIYEDLRTLAGEYDAAVCTASQAVRSAVDKETLDIGDFAEAFEKAAIMDGGIGFSQTKEERIKGICRLVLVGLRGEEDGRAIDCIIRRDRCLMKSVALTDAAGEHIAISEEDDDDRAKTHKTQRRVHSATKKKKHGIRKTKRKHPSKKVSDNADS